jgi:hypothetical protein
MSTTQAPSIPPAVQKEIDNFNAIEQEYRATAFCSRLDAMLRAESWSIDRVIIMGLGPMGDATALRRNGVPIADSSRWQLAFIRHIVDVISSMTNTQIAIYNQDPYADIFQHDPDSFYPATFNAFLEHIGITVLQCTARQLQIPTSVEDLGPAPAAITPTTLFYAPSLNWEATAFTIENRNPEIYIGLSCDTLRRYMRNAIEHMSQTRQIQGRV